MTRMNLHINIPLRHVPDEIYDAVGHDIHRSDEVLELEYIKAINDTRVITQRVGRMAQTNFRLQGRGDARTNMAGSAAGWIAHMIHMGDANHIRLTGMDVDTG